MKCRRKTKQLNNQGLTLVELLVSIAILAIVAGFILQPFITSARVNNKSRNLHRATTVAQNVMEGINLQSIEALAYQFNYPSLTDTDGNPRTNFTLYSAGNMQFAPAASVGEMYTFTDGSGNLAYAKTNTTTLNQYNTWLNDKVVNAGSLQSADSAYVANLASTTYDFMPDLNGVYYFYMQNIENDGCYYNAKIKVDGSPYRTGGSSSLDYNSQSVVQIPTIDSTYDAVEVMGNYDENALTELSYLTGENIEEEDLQRTILIDVTDTLLISGFYKTVVTVTYQYKAKLPDGSWSDVYTYESACPFDNSENAADKQLRNIYLYYFPSYESDYEDQIVINNRNNKDLEVYVIKQENAPQEDLRQAENDYKMKFNVRGETTNNAAGNSHITLHTNLNTNIYEIYSGTALGAVPQATFYRNDGVVNASVFSMTDIKNKQSKDRMFDVTVDIYESTGSASASDLSSIDINTLFTEDKHLVTLTGSMSE